VAEALFDAIACAWSSVIGAWLGTVEWEEFPVV